MCGHVYHLDNIIFTEEDILRLLKEVHNNNPTQSTSRGHDIHLQVTMQNIPVVKVLYRWTNLPYTSTLGQGPHLQCQGYLHKPLHHLCLWQQTPSMRLQSRCQIPPLTVAHNDV